ncbi:Z1 domain-containing protein [Acidipropionibacterium acidipropionici]|uniref:Z1 domain-containing protein n=1 Tax=Acidipropionibacterium acidipropionici TaxID=1748 RepID=UPI00040ABE9B|nr:Z1 domain-containing protein [Acidipropionibacterium acidipropionici]ALN14483.1 hypothetical protein ASQ49_03455 [Acidipropionibacterium acidipropionici]APZ09756.1 hypothetical protein BWX38_11470 [Acidipropionibacterium acidipropionici]
MSDAERTGRAIYDAIRSLPNNRPKPLLRAVARELEDDDLPDIDENELLSLVLRGDANDPIQRQFHIKLTSWDGTASLDDRSAAHSTTAGTAARRQAVLDELQLSAAGQDRVNGLFPVTDTAPTVIAKEWEPWYFSATHRDDYWNRYRDLLDRKNFDPNGIAEIDRATDEVIRRLSNPSRHEAYQSKGLVVGYVQSGKTANFTGLMAKAIDAGYKFIIVLTGTVELLRAQTQKRLDMELVGRENILRGHFDDYVKAEKAWKDAPEVQKADLKQKMLAIAGDDDYASTGDDDWFNDRFVSAEPETDDDIPRITRLTGIHSDFTRLRGGIDALDFKLDVPARSKPLWEDANLRHVGVRLAVVKKETHALEKLKKDLQSIRTRLEDIPALIIDDEADQASINTKKPKPRRKSERTTINGHIADLLSYMPRCQYVAYTATPFANVFVSPDDPADVFPKDFIISLSSSPGYLGAAQLHDLDPVDDETDPAQSNRAAFHRPVPMDRDEPERTEAAYAEALDSFVLSGATKLFRKAHGGEQQGGKFRHHTMLVHETPSQLGHATSMDHIEQLWKHNGYGYPDALDRLEELWTKDHRRVSAVRAPEGFASPKSFAEIEPYIGQALDLIEDGASPAVMVNGSKESDYMADAIAFEKHPVWKILIGGTKLSRGFTVEGLTVSVFTRVATAADTTMQMGRWFGYRPGYSDLVRIYLGCEIRKRGVKSEIDLYDTFTSAAQDEEDFRRELSRFATLDDDGKPAARPIDVPPLVGQRMPWLKPTATNKMYNSRIISKGIGGQLQDFSLQATRGDGSNNRRNFDCAMRILEMLEGFSDGSGATVFRDAGSVAGGAVRPGASFAARYGVVPASLVADLFETIRWVDDETYRPERNFLARSIRSGKIREFAVLVPWLAESASVLERCVDAAPDTPLRLITRNRRQDRAGFSGSSKRQRAAIETIAQFPEAEDGGELARGLRAPKRGALLLTFARDPETRNDVAPFANPDALVSAQDVATHISMSFPYESAGRGIIQREVVKDNLDVAFVERAEAQHRRD